MLSGADDEPVVLGPHHGGHPAAHVLRVSEVEAPQTSLVVVVDAAAGGVEAVVVEHEDVIGDERTIEVGFERRDELVIGAVGADPSHLQLGRVLPHHQIEDVLVVLEERVDRRADELVGRLTLLDGRPGTRRRRTRPPAPPRAPGARRGASPRRSNPAPSRGRCAPAGGAGADRLALPVRRAEAHLAAFADRGDPAPVRGEALGERRRLDQRGGLDGSHRTSAVVAAAPRHQDHGGEGDGGGESSHEGNV